MERIDVTNPAEPKAVFTYLPESDIGQLQKQARDMNAKIESVQEHAIVNDVDLDYRLSILALGL